MMKTRKMSRRHWVLAALGLSPALVYADARWLEPQWIKTRHVRLFKERPSCRLVHFTDLHHKGDVPFLKRVVEKINSLSPDFVCFTGDLIEDSEYLPETLEWLGKIKSPVYGIPGNHDYWAKADFKAIETCFKSTGGAWLLDQQITIPNGAVHITGASCSRWNKPTGVRFIEPKSGGKNIMLLHYPVFVESLGTRQYDLILAGHSHGGQVRIPFWGSLIKPSGTGKYDLGLTPTPSGPLYVNPGLGWFYLPYRFNCRPELTVFEL
jgi:predicted MPP superfamily phosphohydrolase